MGGPANWAAVVCVQAGSVVAQVAAYTAVRAVMGVAALVALSGSPQVTFLSLLWPQATSMPPGLLRSVRCHAECSSCQPTCHLCLQVTFVPPGFTRKPPKYERFIRPTGLRMNKARRGFGRFPSPAQLLMLAAPHSCVGCESQGAGLLCAPLQRIPC